MEQNMDVDRVVVGVDGSEPSIAAMRYAGRLAEAFDAPLEAVIAWTYPRFADPAIVSESTFEKEAAEVLDGAVRQAFAGSEPDGLVRSVVEGSPASTLIERSRSSGMLVVGSRGRGGFAGLRLGSVSVACAEHSHCPVVVVHGDLGRSAQPSTEETR
jgi:nucleotide-binding universal stress UspA family protein